MSAAPPSIISALNLLPHPEGGWYRETWRSDTRVATVVGERSAATAILYALAGGQVSAPHRVQFDELWCWHSGPAIEVIMARTGAGGDADTAVELVTLGPPDQGGVLQTVVPGRTWFGARIAGSAQVQRTDVSVVSCVVAPGFEFSDFELADQQCLATLPAPLRELATPPQAETKS